MNNNISLEQMGAKIKVDRKAKKLSLERTGQLCSLGVPALWFIENGRRNAHILTLKSIADVLGWM